MARNRVRENFGSPLTWRREYWSSGGGAAALTGALSAPIPTAAPVVAPAKTVSNQDVELTGLLSFLNKVVKVLISNDDSSVNGDGGNGGLLIGNGGSSVNGNGGNGGLLLSAAAAHRSTATAATAAWWQATAACPAPERAAMAPC